MWFQSAERKMKTRTFVQYLALASAADIVFTTNIVSDSGSSYEMNS